MRPRILFTSYTADWSGPVHSLQALLQHLTGRFEVAVLFPGQGASAAALQAQGVRCHILPGLGKSAIFAMAQLIRRERFDLVYANNTSGSSENALIAAKLARVAFICHVRGMALRGSWRRFAFLRYADATVAVSRASAQAVSRFVRPRLPYVVHNGVELSAWSGDRQQARARLAGAFDVPIDVPLIVTAAHLCPRKGQEHAVNAMTRVVQEVPDAHLILAGALDRDARYVARIREMIRESGLDDRVRIGGFRTDLAEILPGADLFLHTAVADPHPRAVIEGMAAGLPTVAFSVDGVAETVIEGVTGHLVPSGDSVGLAAAVVGLLRDPDRCAEWGESAKRTAAELFSAASTASKVGDIIELTLKSRTASA